MFLSCWGADSWQQPWNKVKGRQGEGLTLPSPRTVLEVFYQLTQTCVGSPACEKDDPWGHLGWGERFVWPPCLRKPCDCPVIYQLWMCIREFLDDFVWRRWSVCWFFFFFWTNCQSLHWHNHIHTYRAVWWQRLSPPIRAVHVLGANWPCINFLLKIIAKKWRQEEDSFCNE